MLHSARTVFRQNSWSAHIHVTTCVPSHAGNRPAHIVQWSSMYWLLPEVPSSLWAWFCMPWLLIHGSVYHCMVLYAITRYTWFCIRLNAWFWIRSLVIRGVVYCWVHVLVCHRSLWFHVSSLVMNRFRFRCVCESWTIQSYMWRTITHSISSWRFAVHNWHTTSNSNHDHTGQLFSLRKSGPAMPWP